MTAWLAATTPSRSRGGRRSQRGGGAVGGGRGRLGLAPPKQARVLRHGGTACGHFFFLPEKTCGIPSLAAWRACGGARGAAAWMREKPAIPRRILAIEFGLDVLLALDFNRDEFLCIFF